MQITPSNLQAMFTAYDVRFQQAYKALTPWWSQVASQAPSSAAQNTYAWMAKIPTLRKWLGERQIQNVAAYSYTVVNDDYELTMELDRNVIEDDQYGLYNPVIDEMGWQTKKWPDFLIQELLMAGDGNLAGTSMSAAATLCYDGLSFFNAAHPTDSKNTAISPSTQSNYFTGTALTPDNYMKVRSAMMQFKGEDGKPLGVIPDTLIVPPQLEYMGRSILNSDMISFGTVQGVAVVGPQTNVIKGTADLLVVPELGLRPTEWYLISTKRAIKPFLFQQRAAPEFVYFNQPNSEAVFHRRKFVYGVRARGAAGYSVPFLAAKALA